MRMVLAVPLRRRRPPRAGAPLVRLATVDHFADVLQCSCGHVLEVTCERPTGELAPRIELDHFGTERVTNTIVPLACRCEARIFVCVQWRVRQWPQPLWINGVDGLTWWRNRLVNVLARRAEASDIDGEPDPSFHGSGGVD